MPCYAGLYRRSAPLLLLLLTGAALSLISSAGLEEDVDLAAADPQALSVQRERPATLLASQTPLDQPVGELDPELRSTLEALGYLRPDEPPAATANPR